MFEQWRTRGNPWPFQHGKQCRPGYYLSNYVVEVIGAVQILIIRLLWGEDRVCSSMGVPQSFGCKITYRRVCVYIGIWSTLFKIYFGCVNISYGQQQYSKTLTWFYTTLISFGPVVTEIHTLGTEEEYTLTWHILIGSGDCMIT